MDTQQLTRTEAETLAIMLNNAGNHMARARACKPGSNDYTYVWDVTAENSPWHDMYEGFYEIVPAEYRIYI